uniref:Interleukin 17 receptor E n=1 Tax=Anser brachyrhynchus TaxID=132585 RepID=A0A8B9IA97_9AVES
MRRGRPGAGTGHRHRHRREQRSAMGRPVPGAALLAAAAVLLPLLPVPPVPPAGAAVPRLRVSANFECRASGIRGLQLNFLELGSNRASWLQVWRRHRAPGSSPWQVQFDCFPVESGRQVLVSLRTVPDQGLAISRSHLVTAEPPGPVFTHTWVPEARTIEVAVPKGPALMVRLCHQLALECEELPWPFHRQVLVPGGHRVSLPYEFLVPCLCIEASYPHRDSLRSKRCPFQEQPDAYGPELWSSVHFHDYSTSSKDQMAMVLSASCPLRPRATLCWREVAAEAAPCHDVPNSTASEEEQVYTLDKVDVHPLLCFRFSYGNSSHVECPHRPEPAWNVSLSVRGLQLRLHLTSSVPASFSAALCQRRGGQCEPEAPVYTVTRPEGSAPGELALLLPVQVLGSCVLVRRPPALSWCPHRVGANPGPPHPSPSPRSGAQTCASPGSSCSALMVSGAPGPAGGLGGCRGSPLTAPLPVSRRHFGLLGLALALGLVVTVLLLNCRGAWRPPAGEGKVTVVLRAGDPLGATAPGAGEGPGVVGGGTGCRGASGDPRDGAVTAVPSVPQVQQAAAPCCCCTPRTRRSTWGWCAPWPSCCARGWAARCGWTCGKRAAWAARAPCPGSTRSGAAWAASAAPSCCSGAGAAPGSSASGEGARAAGSPGTPTTFSGRPWPACTGSWGRRGAAATGCWFTSAGCAAPATSPGPCGPCPPTACPRSCPGCWVPCGAAARPPPTASAAGQRGSCTG